MGLVRSGKVVGLGLAVRDEVYEVESFDLGQERVRYTRRTSMPGGMVANALVQVARFGVPAHLLSLVGDDAEGRTLTRDLRRAGVAVGQVQRTGEGPTPVAVCLVERRSGERRFLVPDRRRMESRARDFPLTALSRHGLLMLDGHFPGEALRAARRARELGMPIVGDFNRPSPAILRLLPLVDYPIVPEEFAVVYGEGDAERALRRLAERCPDGLPIVTLGKRGGIYLEGDRLRRFKARRARVVDTTGAGDSFHGAFTAALCLGREPREAIDLARRAAALSVGALGGQGHLPTLAEVLA